MNTQKILIVVGVVAVVLVGAYLYSNRSIAPGPMMMPGEGGTAESTMPRSLRALLALGQSQKCTFTDNVRGMTSNGTIYLSGERMRGDFTSTSAEGTVASHMISDGTKMWMWQDNENMGFMMEVPEEDAVSGDTSVTTDQFETPIDLDDTSVDYQCEGWRADLSLFTPPSTVMFHSMAEMMNMGASGSMGAGMSGSDAGMGPGMEAGGGMMDKEALCLSCDSAPDGASRAQCRASLQCD
jgi:hypothetical protein